MSEVDLRTAISSIQKLFGGSRDDWGARTEEAFELCEILLGLPNQTFQIDRGCTVGQFIEKIKDVIPDSPDTEQGIQSLKMFENAPLIL